MTAAAQPRRPGLGATLLIDYGPLLLFFVTNFAAPVPQEAKIYWATGVFMAAMLAAMGFSLVRYRKISPMLWFSGAMVLVFGGLTLWLQERIFIQIKPTIYYLTVAGLLFFGLRTGRNFLKIVLGTAYPGLRERGWTLLTRNWIAYFLAMAVMNEAVRMLTSWDTWVAFKLWFFFPATFIFAAANVPMLLRHGLGDEKPELPDLPPE
jgi:intracellular septation protein